MPQKTNLNISPYFDDYSDDKNFFRVLFRPGKSIQSRELTTLQSILQNQIESFGRYRFKQGELVVPGEINVNNRLHYVKLSSVSEVAVNEDGGIVYKKYDIDSLVGQTIRGISSGVSASVVAVEKETATDADTLFVNYITSGDSTTEETFRQGETLEVVGGINTPLLVVGTDGSTAPTIIVSEDPDTGVTTSKSSPAMGFGSGLKVEEGIYFVNGFFVRNDEELVILDKYNDKPSVKAGYRAIESIVSPEVDPSLYDNARGFTNASAPGANRLKIELSLEVYEYNASTDKDFIQLVQLKNGVIEKQVKPADYTLLEETLAKRTYDESGDYVANNFKVDVREYLQKDGNNGIYKLGEDGTVNGITELDASSKMVLSVSAGKAYVRGFEIVNKETKYLEIDKSRDTLVTKNSKTKTTGLPTYKVSNVYGSVPLNVVAGEVISYPDVFLNSVFNDGSIGLNSLNDDEYKFTVDRRSQNFPLDYGLKTIYVQLSGEFPVTKSQYPTEIWYIKQRSGQLTSEAGKFDVVASSIVNRKNVVDSPDIFYLELTVSGNKDLLNTKLIEYDNAAPGNLTYLFDTQQKALDFGTADPESAEFTDAYYGILRDYNPVLHPTIGICKPKNINLSDRPNGFNQDTDIVISKGRDGQVNPYNAIFNFSYFSPLFFTKIILEQAPVLGFGAGKYIVGKTSGAYGVIENDNEESFSSGRDLFVTTLFGEFIPGETIADEDNNTLKIALENTVGNFIVTSQGSGFGTAAKLALNGKEVDNAKVRPLVDGGIYGIDIIDASALRDTFTSPPEVSILEGGVFNTSAKIIPILNKNVVTTYNPRNVKSLYSLYGNAYKYTADVDFTRADYTSYDQVTSFSFSGKKGDNFLECGGFGINLNTIVRQGDLVQYTGANGKVYKNFVQYTSDAQGTVKSRIYFDYVLAEDLTNVSVVRVRPIIRNENSSLIIPSGSKQIRSLVGNDPANSDIIYYARKDFVTQATTSGNIISFTAQLPTGTQRFVTFSEENYIFTILDAGSSSVVSTGDIVYVPSRYVTIDNPEITSNQIVTGTFTINLPDDYFGNITDGNYPKIKLSATVEIEKGRPRIKTAVKGQRISVTSSGDRIIPFRGADYDSSDTTVLSYSDAYKLNYVYEGTASNPPQVDAAGRLVSGTDVTYKYTFDDGQRDTVYETSRIILKPGFDAPVGQLVISFDYFEHSGGDFCTADSYLHEAGVVPTEIPLFNSNVYGVVSLRDVIDFRPKSDVDTTITGFQDESIFQNPDGKSYLNLAGDGGVPALTPASDSNIEYTINYTKEEYLGRIDGLFLNKKGDFIVKSGNAALNPSKPDAVSDSISLAYINIPAFTDTSRNVRITPVDNRRFTMRDIGKLQKRIERLEYYTALSILEQQTLNMQIKDELGLDRFKSGFFVDNFESHGLGNISSDDYVCAIDTQQSTLRPQNKEDSVGLKERSPNPDERRLNGYAYNNGIVTLPFESLNLLGNTFATKTINPNPFVVLQYVGDVAISPSIDTWYDTTIAPLSLDRNVSHYDIFSAKGDKEGYSSLYNSTVINWVGSTSDLLTINSFGSVESDNVNSSTISATVASSSNVSPQNNEIGKGLYSNSIDGRSISSSIEYFARTVAVKFVLTRMKPNTTLNAFIEGRNINRWVIPDNRFTGIAGNSLSAFNNTLVTDENGSLSGIFLVPSGFAPEDRSSWRGDLDSVTYDTASEEIRISVGEKTIVFSSSSNYDDKLSADSYAEIKFYASGIKPANPSSIVSTAISEFKANEGVQLIDSNTDQTSKPNPLAQTFKVENFSGGLFSTGVDLYFSQKDSEIPLRVYLTDVNTGKPGKNIVPGSKVVLYPKTFLKVFLTGDSDSVIINKEELVTGLKSNASGPIAALYDSNGILVGDENAAFVTVVRNQVYTLVLDNHNGTSFVPNETLEVESITRFNNSNGTAAQLNIAKDSGRVVKLNVDAFGDGYESASITVESPQLPGGSTATGTIDVSNGKIFVADITINGSGYTEAPSVVIRGVGNGAAGAVITSEIEIDTPAVRMGISTDSNAQVRTYFPFHYPVYLQNDTEYALVVETDSINYQLWASRIGETEIFSGNPVTTQPLLGSVYKSQNTDIWTEDLLEDIKFMLYRAEFDISSSAELQIVNEDLGYEKLENNPFETSVVATSNATSKLFKANNKIIKVNHLDHGFEDEGKSLVAFKNSDDVSGISSTIINNTLFDVTNSGVDSYNIESPSRAGVSTFGGGDNIFALYNRKYEKLYAQVPFLQLEGTNINSSIKTTNIKAIDSDSTNFPSYSQTDFERTFLNEEQFFGNQKVIASSVNRVNNDIDNSITYKLQFDSSVSYLSPLIDLNSASVKLQTNRIENSTGFENRFSNRYQKLIFLPIYVLDITVVGALSVDLVPSVVFTGSDSKAEGEIISINAEKTQAIIKLRTQSPFSIGENIQARRQNGTSITVNISLTDSNESTYNFSEGVDVFAVYPFNNNVKYNNIINGRVVSWDDKDKVLIVNSNYRPINDDFVASTSGGDFVRVETDQAQDIFRQGDVVQANDEFYVEVESLEYTTGIDFVPETGSKNTSAKAKYVTKQISIDEPGTAIDVRLTANVLNINDIRVLYKVKGSSIQANFDDIEWTYFNETGKPDGEVVATTENSVSGVFENQSAYQELKFSVSNLNEFDSFAVKVVLKTDNPVFSPKVQDLRVVASY